MLLERLVKAQLRKMGTEQSLKHLNAKREILYKLKRQERNPKDKFLSAKR